MTGIFCANEHLVLDDDQCQVCGWVRPAPTDLGEPCWDPVQLPDELGDFGLAKPAANRKTAVIPLNNGKLVGLNLDDGRILWETSIGVGLACGDIRIDSDAVLCAISDIRPIGQTGEGFLARIDMETGKLTPVWQAKSSKVSDFVISGQRMFLRTSRPELLAFDRSPEPKVVWRSELQTFLFAPPAVAGDKIVVADGEEFSDLGYLKAFDADKGAPDTRVVETSGVNLLPLTQNGKWVFSREKSRQLVAIDFGSAESGWSRAFRRIYTDPVAHLERVYLVVRWQENPDLPREYRLISLDAHTGETIWESTVPERVSLAPAVCHNQVVLGSEAGSLFGFDSQSGNLLWRYRIGSGTSPIITRLVTTGGSVLAATRDGLAAIISIGADYDVDADPEALLEAGDFENAAEVFALQGKFQEAARIYADNLRASGKALALLEHAGLYLEAGELADKLKLNTLALDFYRAAKDPYAEALILVRMGNLLQAAQVLEEIGELDRAAKLYEQINEHRKALDIYKNLHMLTQVARLSELVSGSDEDIAFLEQAGRLKDAARVAEKHARLRKAVDLYGKAQAQEDEYRVLKNLVATEPEEWSLERLALLAPINQDYLLAAQTMDKLNRPRRAAMAYRSAAQEMEGKQPEKAGEIADLYELAMVRFADAGLSEDRENSYKKIIQYRRLPYIVVRARMMDKFREEEINDAILEIENTGLGLAYDVQVQIGGERFEVDEKTGSPSIKRLASQSVERHTTYLRPKERQYGSAVPLHLHWSWSDKDGVEYQNHVTKAVEVRRGDDSDISRPVEIQIQPVEMATSQELRPDDLDEPFRRAREAVLASQSPLKVLYLAANPANMTRLSIDAELRAIHNVIATLPYSNRIDLQYRGAVQTSDLQAALLSEKPTIVHFSGHGSQTGAIYIEDEFGDGHPISSRALGDLFGLLKGNIRFVLLNACYSEEQANAIAEHIDCVIGMSSEIEDDAARAFSTALYRAIGFSTDLQTAFNLGCNAIDIENLDDVNVPKILAPRTDPSNIRFFRG